MFSKPMIACDSLLNQSNGLDHPMVITLRHPFSLLLSHPGLGCHPQLDGTRP
jgi:hypothetical protein